MAMGKRGFLYVFGAIVLFSTIEVVSKYLQSGMGTGKPLGADQVASLRFMLGGLLLLPFAVGGGRGSLAARAVRNDPVPLVLLGVVGVFLTFFLFHQGVERASASTAAVVFSGNPIFTSLLAVLLLKERLRAVGWLGIGLGFLGALAAVTGFHLSGLFSRDDFLGGILVLSSALTWSAYTVYGKRYSQVYGGLTVSFLSIVAGSAMFALLLGVRGGWGELASYDAGTWGWLLYLGMVTVGIGYLLYFEGMRQVPASRGASLFYLKPILALLLAHYALGEPVTYALVFATVMVAAGVLLVTLTRGEGSVGDGHRGASRRPGGRPAAAWLQRLTEGEEASKGAALRPRPRLGRRSRE